MHAHRQIITLHTRALGRKISELQISGLAPAIWVGARPADLLSLPNAAAKIWTARALNYGIVCVSM
jgi:hypothetical protein